MSNLREWDKIISNLFKAFFYGLFGCAFLRGIFSGGLNILTLFLLFIPLWFFGRCVERLNEAARLYEYTQGRK